jgi:hypothetical protein
MCPGFIQTIQPEVQTMINTISAIGFLRQVFPVLLLVAGSGFVQGCADYRVTVPDSHPRDINYQGRTVYALAWGAWYDPQVLEADCGRETINDVVIKRNYLHDLASVFTFGIWMPIEVNFRCASERIRPGHIP